MSRFFAVLLIVGAVMFTAAGSSTAQAGYWAQSQGYWYWYDDNGDCYYADGDNYYRWERGTWAFYAPWSRGFSDDPGFRFDFRFGDRNRDRGREFDRDRGCDGMRQLPFGGGNGRPGGRR